MKTKEKWNVRNATRQRQKIRKYNSTNPQLNKSKSSTQGSHICDTPQTILEIEPPVIHDVVHGTGDHPLEEGRECHLISNVDKTRGPGEKKK